MFLPIYNLEEKYKEDKFSFENFWSRFSSSSDTSILNIGTTKYQGTMVLL